jgi:eukaryotic-like serine/threonine-protein kinase
MEHSQAHRWRDIKALLADALEQPPEQQSAWIARASQGDARLHDELASLVQAAQHPDALLAPMTSPVGTVQPGDRAADEALWIGQHVGAYHITGLVGRGGMGSVYRAERADTAYEQQVAVKLVHAGLDGAARTRFRAERQIAASLDHPNLVKLLDGGTANDGTPYLVMELVDGLPIDAFIQAEQTSPRHIIGLVRSLCAVVHYVHQRGVVHRDLKPSNVLVTPQGKVKLLDFGIAKLQLTDENPGGAERTHTHQIAFTPQYSSPEQIRGEAAKPASDVYALGVLLYRLLSGRSPYGNTGSGDWLQLSRAVCEDDPPPPSAALPRGSAGRRLLSDLDAVILKALRKLPGERYESAEALSDDLFRCLEGLPVRARRGGLGYVLARYVVRHRTGVLTALVASAAFTVASTAAVYQAVQVNMERERAEQHARSVRELARAMLFDVDAAIRGVPGTVAARQTLVKTAQAYLQQLSGNSTDDPSFQHDLGSSYRQLGDILGDPTGNSLGDSKGAEASYQRAIQVLDPLVRRVPASHRAHYDLAIAHQRQAALLAMQYRLPQALAEAEKGIRVAQDHVDAMPSAVDSRMLLASTLGQRSQIRMFGAEIDLFLADNERAANLLEEILKQAPDHLDAGIVLAATHGAVGEYYMQRDTGSDSARLAAVALERAVRTLEALATRHPDSARVGHRLGTNLDDLGSAQARLGQMIEAEGAHRKAHQLLDSLSRRDPANKRIRLESAKAASSLGGTVLELNRLAEAASLLRTAQSTFDGLPETMRGEPLVQYVTAQNLERLSRLYTRQTAWLPCVEAARHGFQILDAINKRYGLEKGHLQPQALQQALRHCESQTSATTR